MKRILALLIVLSFGRLTAEEGMYPVSQVRTLNLKKLGFQISASDIYNPNGTGLINAVVHLGGCTGSFVSADGLILTNHHCAFGSVAAISTTEKDYVTNGFLAQSRADELPARGQTVRLIESYRDVSAEVLAGVTDTTDPAARTRMIDRAIRSIVLEAEKRAPGRRAEVAEMFTGKSYVLFVSFMIRDVRLVYVPPRSVGEFGGEDDNWMWPRHTGDFSFLRAYVAPDGSPVEYSPSNVPYHPVRHLKVNPAGVEEEDRVFILGYPGRTFRHRTSHFMAYEEDFRMPFVADLYEWEIATMEQMGKSDRAVALKHDARIKGLANVSKNYRGKLKGMSRLHLVDRKREEEALFQKWIDAHADRKAKAGRVLSDIAGVYAEMSARAPYELLFDQIRPTSTLLGIGMTLADASRERMKPDSERTVTYADRNAASLRRSIRQSLANYHEPTERLFLKKLFVLAGALPASQRIAALDAAVGGSYDSRSLDAFIDSILARTNLVNADSVVAILDGASPISSTAADPFLRIAFALQMESDKLRDVRQRREGALSKASALLLDFKAQYQKASFIPDANSTLRFTYGHIRGYSPADAVSYRPITTLTGVIEKTRNEDPWNTPQTIRALAAARDYGRYRSARLKDVPVAILYDTDTTGGNSGSPVMNAKGELIGVNFDRTFEATINDFAWNESYSRSIAVDIRYILWVTGKVAGAQSLVNEMIGSPSPR